ncbi:AAA family ATPase [Acaryochloris marina]|uniref:Replication-associated recombination protein A n=1 Tax=Acaryochloris marina (strain MBIC 11017) TaxID=329726 RepID=B0CAJ0_ACAM1|nr:AAA family ATPase [Acaryochloris marina]ABW29056.1 ATPase, AAA family protein [Acaryochloris marina MBIC11017]BDM78016.1 ATPase AAA [Acaryochloris marina MBIC10699]
MDLFEQHRQQLLETEAPLAARLRPRTLDEFVGQDEIVGPGRLLRRAIQADQLSSLIFYGPPGTGKTTLAQIIANTTQAHFLALNAVLAGIKDIRSSVDEAQDRRGQYGQRTILFVDEVHRFNKAQQDALLPWVENGTVILIGATTENPYFEVNKALVSRSRIFQLRSLMPDDLRQVLERALQDKYFGYGDTAIELEGAATEHLINVANGDARALLNALELAIETTEPDDQGVIPITLAVAEASIQRRAVLYDKEGDAHFDTISAFIKSMRGSDPDAALYWLARMVYAGEDPRFIFRRMIILASEDVGLADPQAVGVVMACAQAFDRIGLPEGQYPLAQAALYLSTAPKSNSALAYFDALASVEKEREGDVPNPLRDKSRDKHAFGHGANYKYPHAYRDHWVAQQYLPDSLQGQVFYQPSDQGAEAAIQTQIARQREAQLSGISETSTQETVSYGPKDSKRERWLQRTMSQTGDHAAWVRDRIFSFTQIQRHHVVLEVCSQTGLLTWEALRRTPEGSVYTHVSSDKVAQTLEAQVKALSALQRPICVAGSSSDLKTLIYDHTPDLQFDWILGRNTFANQMHQLDRPAAENLAQQLISLLRPEGQIVLAETIPKYGQRICDLVKAEDVGQALYQRWQTAEAALYQGDTGDTQLTWDESDLQTAFADQPITIDLEQTDMSLYVTPKLIERWFATSGDRLSYGKRLGQHCSATDVKQIQALLTQKLLHQTIQWQTTLAFVHVRCAK